MITKRKLRAAIERYVEARIAKSWKGSKMPDEFAEIEADVVDTKQKLDELIAEVIFKIEEKPTRPYCNEDVR